jgi:hypothetical protein
MHRKGNDHQYWIQEQARRKAVEAKRRKLALLEAKQAAATRPSVTEAGR